MKLLKWLLLTCAGLFFSCKEKTTTPSLELIKGMSLKKGELISCGASGSQLGSLNFMVSGTEKIKADFNLGVKLLHSFEYDEAEKAFAKVIDEEPGSAMAYWGVAMSNFHPLWSPPTQEELRKGSKAVEIAKSIDGKTKREEAYINAIASFYEDWEKTDHRTRCLRFEKSMKELNTAYPDDKETAIFYALSLDAAADPADKTYSKQKKAGAILNALYPGQPDHPGIIHYIIHSYDSPELAELALPAARRYASVAPSSAHALHMPSHIFTRLGLWDECIKSNLQSASSAQCYAKSAGIKGHYDEEMHALDYLMYAYLQKGDNKHAMEQLDYLNAIEEVQPFNFKVAYAFASIPSRYVFENKNWKDAANLEVHFPNASWNDYPWQKAIVNFTRLMGCIHSSDLVSANKELKELNGIHQKLVDQKDAYKANQVAIQIRASEAWIRYKEGKNNEAISLMKEAAEMEDKTEKHPVTPGEVIPARELLGDLFIEMNKPAEAFDAYEADIKKHPNRFNGVYGAAFAAEKSGNSSRAKFYYEQLLSLAKNTNSDRKELKLAEQFVKGNKVLRK
jgi:tetratricopeptide (TPR) repeat protein